jgi:integrase
LREYISAAAFDTTTLKTINEEIMVDRNKTRFYTPPHSSDLLDRKIENITTDLLNFRDLSKDLHEISLENALAISEFIIAMRTEINLSDNYRRDNIRFLCAFSKYNKNRSFQTMTRNDIISFLDSYRRPEAADPLHKWIGTYNLFRTYLIRFFKWLYYPNIESDKRPKPEVVDNISQLKRKEQFIYKPTDLWTAEDNLLFLKYCPTARAKCFHAISCDTGCRPHELLKLRIRNISFKNAGNKQYAEVLVNGKTGSRLTPHCS